MESAAIGCVVYEDQGRRSPERYHSPFPIGQILVFHGTSPHLVVIASRFGWPFSPQRHLPVAEDFFPYMRSLHKIQSFQAEAACGSSSLPVRVNPIVALYERADHPGRFPANPVFHRALADPTLHKTLVMVGEEVGYGLV